MEESKKKKSRGDNWFREEKELFLDIIKKSVKIIENKSTTTDSNNAKLEEWRKIQKLHCELSGNLRSIPQLKGAWRRFKRIGISMRRIAVPKIEGGDKPPSPTEDTKRFEEIFTMDSVDEDNKDNDSIFNNSIIMKNEVNQSIDSEDPCSSSKDYFEYFGDISEIKEKDQKEKEQKEKEQKENKKPLKNTIIETNVEFKKKAQSLLEEEHELKMKFHKKELEHQAVKQRLEIEILQLEKYKKELEIEKLMTDN